MDLLPGIYCYTYPTFVDKPQLLCLHFLTPDRQQAFVSFPHHPARRAAELVAVSWFERVRLVPLDVQPQLMPFLEEVLPSWLRQSPPRLQPTKWRLTKRAGYRTCPSGAQ